MTTIPRELESEKVYADEIDASEGRLDKIRAAKKAARNSQKKGDNGDDLELGDSSDQDFERRGVGSNSNTTTNNNNATDDDVKTAKNHTLPGTDDAVRNLGSSGNERSTIIKSEEPDIEKAEAGYPIIKPSQHQGSPDTKKDNVKSKNDGTMGTAGHNENNIQNESSPKKKPLPLRKQEPIVQLSFYVAAISFGLACLVALVMIILLSTVGT